MIDEEKILIYKMTPKEAKAYRLALLWISLTRKFLPEDSSLSCATLPKGDPRKGYLFKMCWKLLRETEGLLVESDYKYYFAAQLSMLKGIARSKGHAHVSHNCFVGEKAWVRWKIWKKKFEEQAKEYAPTTLQDDQIIKQLDRTKAFLKASASKFTLNDLKVWVNSGDVSLVYVGLSPIVKKLTSDPANEFNYDPSLLERKLTPKVQDHFQSIFEEEYE